jgi:hypothetical protein
VEIVLHLGLEQMSTDVHGANMRETKNHVIDLRVLDVTSDLRQKIWTVLKSAIINMAMLRIFEITFNKSPTMVSPPYRGGWVSVLPRP